MSKVAEFRGDYAFLSNFHPSMIEADGAVYSTVEHAYQAAKTNDPDLKEQIRLAPDARAAKKLGRKVQIASTWDQDKFSIMKNLVTKKFQIFDLKLKLLLTGEKELVEGNYWGDAVWGVTRDGVGENRLGKILMEVRDEIRANEGCAMDVFHKYLEHKGLDFMGNVFKKLGNQAIDISKAFEDDSLNTLDLYYLDEILDSLY